MKLFSILLFFSLLSTVSFGQDFTIRGIVYNDKNGEPMPFEKVRLLAADSSVVSGGVTDENGFYQISKLSKGSYIIKVESFGYVAQTQNVTVTEEKGILDANFTLKQMTDVM